MTPFEITAEAMTREGQDRTMYENGYRYRCDPQSPAVSPYVSLYAKDLKGVTQIHRDWPTQLFTVVHL